MDTEILDDLIMQHISKDPQVALAEAISSIQRAAYLLDTAPSKAFSNDQRLVAGLLINTRILYLYFNDHAGTVDAFALELALRKAK